MAELYTTKILTPSLCAFHDIEGVTSIQNWINSSTPGTTASLDPSYPFYYKQPLPPYYKTQFGFAPRTTFTFFSYGTEFINTTACYEIFDEYNNDPVSGPITSPPCKYIPPLSQIIIPPSGSVISEVTGITAGAAIWYVTVSRHPVNLEFKATSYVVVGVVVNNEVAKNILTLNTNNETPEISFNVFFVNSSLQLAYTYDTLYETDASYNFVINSISLPKNTTNINNSSYYFNYLTSSQSIFQLPISNNMVGGRAYSFIWNDTAGAFVETVFASGGPILTQSSTMTQTSGIPSGLDINVDAAGNLYCSVPSGSWYVSGVFIEGAGSNSNTPKAFIETSVTSTTLIDTITSYDNAVESIYGEPGVTPAGSVAAKYDLLVNVDNELVENRQIYLNWYLQDNDINAIEQVTTNSTLSSNTFTFSAVQDDVGCIKLYGIPNNNSHTWNICGYKTEINYVNVFNELISAENILSGSWIGDLNSYSVNIGNIQPIIIDTVYYYTDVPTNKLNYAGTWEVLLVVPGGDFIAKKTLNAIWSDPALGLLEYTQEAEIYYDKTNLYPSISASLNLFCYYDINVPFAPIYVALRTNVPLECYICRQLYSNEVQHFNNITSKIALTGLVNGPNIIIDTNSTLIEQSKHGAEYVFLVQNTSNLNDNALYYHKQLTNVTDLAVDTETLVTNTTQNILITSQRLANTINLVLSSDGATEFYVAGYKLYNFDGSSNVLYSNANFVNVSSFNLDTIADTTSYDADWHVTVKSFDETKSKTVYVHSIFDDVGGLSYKTSELTAANMQSQFLSAIKIQPIQSNDTIILNVSSVQADLATISGIQLFWYRYGTSNFCIETSLNPLLPIPPNDSQIDYTFTYPGTYTVRVSALSGSSTNVTAVISAEHYFKIIDIPPLVRFDITNDFPQLNNYTPEISSGSENLSYYNNNITFNSLTGYEVYINTWPTAPGSFPVQSIWVDYGDGSDIEKIYRNRPIETIINETTAFPQAEQDPRNYVFYHKYMIPDRDLYSYTVTVTAFNQNTNSFTTGSKTISGLGPAAPVKKYLLTNSILTDKSIVYNIQTDNSSKLTLVTPAIITPIKYPNSRYYQIQT